MEPTEAAVSFEAIFSEEEVAGGLEVEQFEVGQTEVQAKQASTEEAEKIEEDIEVDPHAAWASEMQESLGDNPDLLDNLKIRVKIAGEEKTLTVAELKASTMMDGDYRKKTQALAEQRKAFEAESTAKLAQISQSLTEFSSLAKMAETELLSSFNEVDWKNLREYDPGEYAAKRQEYEVKYQQIQQAKVAAQTQASQAKDAHTTQARERGFQELLSKVPEWTDQTKREADFTEYRKIAEEFGAIGTLANSLEPGVVLLLKELHSLRTKLGPGNTLEKVRTLPKYIKPGATQSNSSAKKKIDAITYAKRTGKISDAALAFEHLL